MLEIANWSIRSLENGYMQFRSLYILFLVSRLYHTRFLTKSDFFF